MKEQNKEAFPDIESFRLKAEHMVKLAKENAKLPILGSIVYYQKYGTPGGEHKAEPSPAVITKVLDDTGKCALFVMNPNGCYFNETPYSDEPKPGHWNWPTL